MSDFDKYISFENRIDVSVLFDKMAQVKSEVKKVIVGQDQLIDMLLISILASGHSLIQGLPWWPKHYPQN